MPTPEENPSECAAELVRHLIFIHNGFNEQYVRHIFKNKTETKDTQLNCVGTTEDWVLQIHLADRGYKPVGLQRSQKFCCQSAPLIEDVTIH